MKKGFKIKMVLKFAAMFAFFALAIGYVTMGLWNWLVPALFGGPVITYLQAIGLLILSKILFGGFKGKGQHRGGCGNGHWGRHSARHEYFKQKMEERFANMTPEEQEKFRNRCSNWNTKE